MPVFHAGRRHLHVIPDLLVQGAVNIHLTEHRAQLLERDTARTQQARTLERERDYRAFHADAARAAIQYSRDLAVHIMHDVRRRGRGRSAGRIRGRSCQRYAALPNQRTRHRVRRQANAHGVQSARNLVRDAVALRYDHGQRTRPERVCKQLRLRRNRRTQVVNLVKVRDMDDQRVILRTAFREENFLYRLAVQRIRRKAVHGFGRHADDLARSNEFCGGFYRIFVGFRDQKSCFHQFTLPFMVSMVFFFHFGDNAVSRQRDVYRTFTMLYSNHKRKECFAWQKTRTFSSR